MRKEVVFQIATVLLAMIGIYVLLNSPRMGHDAMSSYFSSKMGGFGDTTTYIALLENYISSYQLLGSILLGSGLLGMFILYKKDVK